MTTAIFNGDTVGAIALIAVLAFVIDRVVSTLMFFLSFNSVWSRRFPDPNLRQAGQSRIEAERKQKLIYLLMAGALSLVVILSFGRMSILSAFGVQYPRNPPAVVDVKTGQNAPDDKSLQQQSDRTLQNVPAKFIVLDVLLTALLLMGGADRMGQLVRMIGGAGSLGTEKPEPQPLQVTGRLTFEEHPRKASPPDGRPPEEASS